MERKKQLSPHVIFDFDDTLFNYSSKLVSALRIDKHIFQQITNPDDFAIELTKLKKRKQYRISNDLNISEELVQYYIKYGNIYNSPSFLPLITKVLEHVMYSNPVTILTKTPESQVKSKNEVINEFFEGNPNRHLINVIHVPFDKKKFEYINRPFYFLAEDSLTEIMEIVSFTPIELLFDLVEIHIPAYGWNDNNEVIQTIKEVFQSRVGKQVFISRG